MSERVLIIGKGFLGSHLEKKLKELNNDVFTTGFNTNDNVDFRLDVRNEESITDCIKKIKPNYIINCSANVDSDFLEKNPTFIKIPPCYCQICNKGRISSKCRPQARKIFGFVASFLLEIPF